MRRVLSACKTMSTEHVLCGSILFLGCVSLGSVAASAQNWNDVLPQVKQRCVRIWPDDYSKQAHCIKEQHDGWVAVNGSDSAEEKALAANKPRGITPQPAPVSDQQAEAVLIDTVVQFETLYESAPNDMIKGGLRPERGQALCILMPALQVRNWRGTVYSLSSNSDGDGVVEIDLDQGIHVETINNNFNDSKYHTLIPHGTRLFADVSALNIGQAIEFSGTLFHDDRDCFKENSPTVNEAMTEPEFLIRLTSVKHEDVVAPLTPAANEDDAVLATTTSPASRQKQK
jgi:hypothetical protein